MDDQPEISILDSRLAEIDRRLHVIQSGLSDEAPVAAPGPRRIEVPGEAPEPDTPGAQSAAALIARLRELTTAQEGVLSSIRELLGAVERVAMAEPPAPVPTSPPVAAPAPVSAPASTPAAASLSVSAGPFASTEALRSFQATLESLPEVRAVELRGFEGGDRALLDVHL